MTKSTSDTASSARHITWEVVFVPLFSAMVLQSVSKLRSLYAIDFTMLDESCDE